MPQTDVTVYVRNLPVNSVIMWWGDAAHVPTGWALCDGTLNTPDLVGRFVLGAGGEHYRGATGGEFQHTLTVDEMPAHSHNTYTSAKSNNNADGNNFPVATPGKAPTSSAGKGKSFNVTPPYCALYFIMKTT